MKVCKKCKIEKEEIEFSLRRNICKKCRSEYACNNYRKKEEDFKKKRRQRYKENRGKEICQSQKYYDDHRDQILEYRKEMYIKNREIEIEKSTNYRLLNKEKVSEYNKKYYPKYREINKEIINRYLRNKRKTDINFRLAGLIRGRIKDFLKGRNRSLHSFQLLDCSIDFLKEHLQQTAIQNSYLDFDINNYSGKDYHIDHIIPCTAFDLNKEEEQKKCFHWSNLQILSSYENLIKSNTTTINTNKESSNG